VDDAKLIVSPRPSYEYVFSSLLRTTRPGVMSIHCEPTYLNFIVVSFTFTCIPSRYLATPELVPRFFSKSINPIMLDKLVSSGTVPYVDPKLHVSKSLTRTPSIVASSFFVNSHVVFVPLISTVIPSNLEDIGFSN